MISLGRSVSSADNVKRQAAQTGVRPGGSSKAQYSGADPKKMTDEQLDAVIAAQMRR